MIELTEGLESTLIETAKSLRGVGRRLFMARTVRSLGEGGQRHAEAEFGRSRVTIRLRLTARKSWTSNRLSID